MTVILNASNTAGLVLTSDTSGNVAIQSNGSNAIVTSGANVTFGGSILGNVTLTGGLTVGANAAPCFSAYLGAATQSMTENTYTKLQINTKEFDTNGNFDTANYRFLPTVAGYYQLNACVTLTETSSESSKTRIALYKNGSIYKIGNGQNLTGLYNDVGFCTISAVVYANGTSDYFDVYALSAGSNAGIANGNTTYQTYFNGCLIRSA